ncbi:APC family permease [Alicyclobacillaceae bacterium I2511]|nr:APC family permease [Alicyclobacillaceae bacterium I2511]
MCIYNNSFSHFSQAGFRHKTCYHCYHIGEGGISLQEHLRKALHAPEVWMIGINGVIGGGIFLLPGQVAKLAGPQALWAYLVAGGVCILIGLSFAELSSMTQRTGGAYAYATAAMGETLGFTVGWMAWLTYLVGWAALANGFVSYLATLFPVLAPWRAAIIILVIGLLCLLNTLGVKSGSVAIAVFTVAKVVPLLLLIVVALFVTHPAMGGSLIHPAHLHFGQAVLILIFAYGGFEMAAIPAGEMVNPRRTVAVAILGTLLSVTVFYMLIQGAAMHIDPHLATAQAPLAEVGRLMFAGGLTVMTLGAALSILGTQSGVALAAPRTLYALALDNTLPRFFAYTHRRRLTPVRAIWITGILAILLAVTGTFQHLLLLNVAARMYEYLMVCLSVIVLRIRPKTRTTSRPFRLPLGWTLPALASVLSLWLILQESLFQLEVALAALLVGLALHLLHRSRRHRLGSET